MNEHKHRHHDGGQHRKRCGAADINGKLIMNLRDISHTMRSLYEGKCSQKRILMMMSEMGETTQTELTERLGVRSASVSEIVGKLEKAGAIVRRQGEGDRRTVILSLTDSGKEFAHQAKEQRDRRHEEMFYCLTDDEKDSLLYLLEKINSDWEQRYRSAEECRGHHRKSDAHREE
ncbi:MAG: MarR family winged helix-turn-helix transcriptional regulator [Oscillospiraceae bacterium]